MEGRGGNQPFSLTATPFFMGLDGLIGKLLKNFESLAARMALVFIERHTATTS
jgi:hypothetical protein